MADTKSERLRHRKQALFGCRQKVKSAPTILATNRHSSHKTVTNPTQMSDDTPRTRTELKRGGKKDKGPYSAKHVRAAEALAAKRAAAAGPPTTSTAGTGPKKRT